MSQVGFTFQGDVFTGGSLVMNTTGRLLKALSDGNVDVLAVAASLQLGKSIPITRTQEAIVARSMQKRNVTRSGILAKALSVGWGHSDVAYELSRTRAGCATLLLLNALSSGVSTFKAAEGLQELLVCHGCSSEILPTVDSLNSVINYVSPIMIDSGFHAIMEYTHIAITVAMKKAFSVQDVEKWQPDIMRDAVDMKEWIDSVRQLCWSASLKESVCIRINGRIAWLATFAVHILGMGCTIMCGATVLWETAGSSGKLVIGFGPYSTTPVTDSLAGALRFSLEPEDDVGTFPIIRGRYLLKDALRCEIEKCATTPPSFYAEFCLFFVRYFSSCLASDRQNHAFSIVLEDNRPKVISRVLGYLGVELTTQLQTAMLESLSMESPQDYALKLFNCFKNLFPDSERFADNLTTAMTVIALSLVSCCISFDNFSVPTLNLRLFNKANWYYSGEEGPSLRLSEMWSILRTLSFVGEHPGKGSTSILAKSADGNTLSVRMLFEDEAFTRDGQIFAIYTGQLAYAGIKRQIAVASDHDSGGRSFDCGQWALAPGIIFKHPHIPASTIVDIKTTVAVRDALIISTIVTIENQDSRCKYCFNAVEALSQLTQYGTLADPCPHPIKNSFPVPLKLESDDGVGSVDSLHPGHSNWPLTFSAAILATSRSASDCVFLCLPGKSQFLQLLSMAMTHHMSGRLKSPKFVLQEDACLSCAVDQGRHFVNRKVGVKKTPFPSLAFVAERPPFGNIKPLPKLPLVIICQGDDTSVPSAPDLLQAHN